VPAQHRLPPAETANGSGRLPPSVLLALRCHAVPQTWWLIFYATMACFVGRLHIYVGSIGVNCFRSSDGEGLPPISGLYMFMMWFSGLRGGVAFALASVSYAARDFGAVCGGLPESQRANNAYCSEGMSDSLAILQTTLIIATFTIFVFGGSITKLAIACDVLEKKTDEKEEEEDVEKEGCAANARNCLTFGDHIKEKGTRYEEAIEHTYQDLPQQPGRGESLLFSQMPTTPVTPAAAKAPLAGPSEGIEMSKMTPSLLTMDDKIDYLRETFPSKSTVAIKKLISSAGGDVTQAVVIGQSQGFTD
jgi:sodium/hydrogen exchanger 8